MSGNYRMNLIWSSHGEQLRADLERNLGALTNTRTQLRGGSRDLGTFGAQARAVGTTIRYALAGSVVYGVTTAVASLSDFEAKLGDIDALAARIGQGGKLVGLGAELNRVGDYALQVSNKFGIAVPNVEDYMARFYSSFDPPAGQRGIQQMREFVNEVSQLTVALGGEVGDPQALASGIAGMMQSIPGSRQNVGGTARRLSNIIAETTRLSPVLTGQDITRDIGRLSGAQNFSRMTPEQIFAVYGAASRSGGSGAVIGRGITQLLGASIMHPTNKNAVQAFQQIGLPTDPNALRQMGGWAVLRTMLERVQTGPVSFRNAAALRSGDLEDADAVQQAGARGINMNVAARLFPRQESMRQFLNLLSLGGPKALDDFIKSINEAEKHNRSAQRAQLALDQQQLRLAGNAQRNLNVQVIRGFDPLLRTLASGITHTSDALIGHRTATAAAVTGVAGASLASRIFMGTGLLGAGAAGLQRIPGIRGMMARNPALARMFGRGAARGGEMAAASLVGSGLGAFSSQGKGTRADPMWVVIDPLSWFMPGSPSGGMGGGGGGTDRTPPVVAGWSSRLARAARRGGRAMFSIPGAAAGGLMTLPLWAGEAGDWLAGMDEGGGRARAVPGGNRFRHLRALSRNSNPMSLGMDRGVSRAQQRVLDDYIRRYISPQTAETRLARLARGEPAIGAAGGRTRVEGQADVTVHLVGDDAIQRFLKDVDKTLHVPTKLWNAMEQSPSFRGKPRATRGSRGGR